jgi:hypothetical protein
MGFGDLSEKQRGSISFVPKIHGYCAYLLRRRFTFLAVRGEHSSRRAGVGKKFDISDNEITVMIIS